MHVDLPHVLEAPAELCVAWVLRDLRLALPQKSLWTQPCTHYRLPRVKNHRFCGVLLPHLQDVIVDMVSHVDPGLQVGGVLRLLVGVERYERLRHADAAAAEGPLLPRQVEHQAVLVQGKVHLVHARRRRHAIQPLAHLAEPPVQADVDVDGLLEPADEEQPPLLLDVLRPPGHEADDARPGSHLLACKLHADLPDDLCRCLRPQIAEVLQHPQLAGLEEKALGPERPLALVDLEGQHNGPHKVAVRVAVEVLGQQVREPSPQLLEEATVREPVVHDLDQLHGAALYDLVQDVLWVEHPGAPVLVWVETSDIVDRGSSKGRQQVIEVCNVVPAH
mmetsp:Transcript_1680/g.5046  ORF Transcript_1680/g.5046 Transcript_1680/m.5046 type:complete len:334 (+) Transcript_1680:536-1537(+)